MILSEATRFEIWKEFMAWLGTAGESVALAKADLLAAVADMDDGIDANQELINAFIADTTAAGLTTVAKNRLFALVLARRLQEGI